MNNKITAIAIGIVVFAILSWVVIACIGDFGEQRVIAFASAMSFVATAVAAMAAFGYLRQQAKTARIMEADLRYRITPHLQFRTQAGQVTELAACVENVGRGVAANVRCQLTFTPSNRRQELDLRGWIEPNKVRNLSVRQAVGETGFSVLLSYTDSVGINRYTYTRGPDGGVDLKCDPLGTEI